MFVLNAKNIECELTLEKEIISKLEKIASKYNTTIDHLVGLLVRVEYSRDTEFSGFQNYFEG